MYLIAALASAIEICRIGIFDNNLLYATSSFAISCISLGENTANGKNTAHFLARNVNKVHTKTEESIDSNLNIYKDQTTAYSRGFLKARSLGGSMRKIYTVVGAMIAITNFDFLAWLNFGRITTKNMRQCHTYHEILSAKLKVCGITYPVNKRRNIAVGLMLRESYSTTIHSLEC